jgi:hypothetical protein
MIPYPALKFTVLGKTSRRLWIFVITNEGPSLPCSRVVGGGKTLASYSVISAFSENPIKP